MNTDDQKIRKIKEAVRRNFDLSFDPYQAFEDRYGFFRSLNGKLLVGISLPVGAGILDVGCGTGASSAQMLEMIPECRLWGVDISQTMLDTARKRVPESERLSFVLGDAAKLSNLFDFSFDAIIYSASIFLIPDYEESLKQAEGLLKNNGWVGLTFMDGVYDAEDRNLIAAADELAREGVSLKKPVDWAEFEAFFQQLFPGHRSWKEDFVLPDSALRGFFYVPAMSAGLFPSADYPERVRRIDRLFDFMPATQKRFRWKFMVGRKKS